MLQVIKDLFGRCSANWLKKEAFIRRRQKILTDRQTLKVQICVSTSSSSFVHSSRVWRFRYLFLPSLPTYYPCLANALVLRHSHTHTHKKNFLVDHCSPPEVLQKRSPIRSFPSLPNERHQLCTAVTSIHEPLPRSTHTFLPSLPPSLHPIPSPEEEREATEQRTGVAVDDGGGGSASSFEGQPDVSYVAFLGLRAVVPLLPSPLFHFRHRSCCCSCCCCCSQIPSSCPTLRWFPSSSSSHATKGSAVPKRQPSHACGRRIIFLQHPPVITPSPLSPSKLHVLRLRACPIQTKESTFAYPFFYNFQRVRNMLHHYDYLPPNSNVCVIQLGVISKFVLPTQFLGKRRRTMCCGDLNAQSLRTTNDGRRRGELPSGRSFSSLSPSSSAGAAGRNDPTRHWQRRLAHSSSSFRRIKATCSFLPTWKLLLFEGGESSSTY